MGAMSGLLGTGGGSGGTGFKPMAAPNIQSPVTQAQTNAADFGVNNSFDSGNKLLAALQGQGGIQNQANVYGQGQDLYGQLAGNNGAGIQAGATGQQQNLNAGLAGLNGVGAQGAAMSGQSGLNNQLGGLNGAGMINSAAGQQGALNNQLSGAGGVNAQTGAISGMQHVLAGQQGLAAQQQNTANQYQNIANGTGPNPAQAALNQSTGQNVANQASLMAGQRGAGANVGLLARQAAQQGAATQQQAVGQAATMQANQQLAGLQGLAGQQQAMGNTQQQMGTTNMGMGQLGSGLVNQNQAGIGAMGNLGTSTVGQQQTGINNQYNQGASATGQQQVGIQNQFGQGATTVGQQQNQMGINSGIASNQVGNEIGVTNQNTQGHLVDAGNKMNAMGQYNTNVVSGQNSINAGNAGLGSTRMGGQSSMIGGLLNGAGAVGSGLLNSKSSSGGGTGGNANTESADNGGQGGANVGGNEGANVGNVAATGGMVSQGHILHLADGGMTTDQSGAVAAPAQPAGPQSAFGQFLNGFGQNQPPGVDPLFNGASNLVKSFKAEEPEVKTPPSGGSSGSMLPLAGVAALGASQLDKAGPAVKTIGEKHEAARKKWRDEGPLPKDTNYGVSAGAARGGMAQAGGAVKASSPAEKATKPGNSYANDKVKALLSEGEVVLPRSVMQSNDPVRSAADFVSKVLARRASK